LSQCKHDEKKHHQNVLTSPVSVTFFAPAFVTLFGRTGP
jgi:hypothetical protein